MKQGILMNILKIFHQVKNGSILPDEHHIIRYCPPSKWSKAQQEIFSSAFELSENDLKAEIPYLSCGYLEYYTKNSFKKVCDDISKIRNVKDTGCFIKLNIGKIKEIGKQKKHPDIIIKKLKSSKAPSYSGIFKTTNDEQLRIQLAVEATLRMREFNLK